MQLSVAKLTMYFTCPAQILHCIHACGPHLWTPPCSVIELILARKPVLTRKQNFDFVPWSFEL